MVNFLPLEEGIKIYTDSIETQDIDQESRLPGFMLAFAYNNIDDLSSQEIERLIDRLIITAEKIECFTEVTNHIHWTRKPLADDPIIRFFHLTAFSLKKQGLLTKIKKAIDEAKNKDDFLSGGARTMIKETLANNDTKFADILPDRGGVGYPLHLAMARALTGNLLSNKNET